MPTMARTPRRSTALKVFLRELDWTPTKRYVELLRERGDLLVVGQVDVDVPELVRRPFSCDCHRCIAWSGETPLVDGSCCSRYTVPVTGVDRRKVHELLDRVRERLPADHRLQDPGAEPFEVGDDYGHNMVEGDKGVCQFVLYEQGRSHCAIHKTCLEEGLPVWEYKPLSCSLWPVAFVDYVDEDGRERYLLTVYGKASGGLFEQEDDGDGTFACLEDQDAAYAPMYRSVEGILSHLLGAAWYAELDRKARGLIARANRP